MFPDKAAALFDCCHDHYISSGQPVAIEAMAAGIVINHRTKTAQKLYKDGENAEAQIMKRELCEEYTEDAEAWQLRGELEGTLNQLDTAEACFKRAITLQNDLPAAHKGLEKILNLKKTNV